MSQIWSSKKYISNNSLGYDVFIKKNKALFSKQSSRYLFWNPDVGSESQEYSYKSIHTVRVNDNWISLRHVLHLKISNILNLCLGNND